MSEIRVAINGFGRIGRVALRAFLKNPRIKVVAVNDLADSHTLAHLFKYDSVHGKYQGVVSTEGSDIVIDGKTIVVINEKDPLNLPWKNFGIDVVIESTGLYTSSDKAGKHLEAGAGKVIISAPASSDDIKSVVLGVNDHILDGSERIISNASCTTNCVAPMIKILDDNWGVETAFVSTVHSYTNDQRLQDAPHKDLRRARAAASSIIPTTTGAAKAVSKIFPHLDGKLGGCGIRVPVPDGSLTDLTCNISRTATVAEINEAFRKAADGNLKGILEFCTDPIVSIDIIGNPHSCIIDAELTAVIEKTVKLVGWYDNEAGYSARLADLVVKIGGK